MNLLALATNAKKLGMNFFDIVAPIYEIVHPGAKKSFLKIKKLGNFQKDDRVLDLGGGKGRIAKFFVNQLKEIIIIDDSPGMIKQCQRNSDLRCILAKAENLPFNNNYFDKVIIIDAFHHFKDSKVVCSEIQRVLKPKGKLIIEELNSNKFFIKLFGKIENLLGMKNNFYSPESLANLFSQHEFQTEVINKNQIIYYLVGEMF